MVTDNLAIRSNVLHNSHIVENIFSKVKESASIGKYSIVIENEVLEGKYNVKSKKTLIHFGNDEYKLKSITKVSRPDFGIDSYTFNFRNGDDIRLDYTVIDGIISSVHQKESLGPFEKTVNFKSSFNSTDLEMRCYSNQINSFAANLSKQIDKKKYVHVDKTQIGKQKVA